MINNDISAYLLSLFKPIVKEAINEALKEHSKRATPLHYSKKEFGNLIGKKNSWIDKERRENRLQSLMIGGEVRIPHSELIRLSLIKS